MGLNMPAKTVIFTAVKKWDGDSHRYIGSGEYIQVTENSVITFGSGNCFHTCINIFLMIL